MVNFLILGKAIPNYKKPNSEKHCKESKFDYYITKILLHFDSEIILTQKRESNDPSKQISLHPQFSVNTHKKRKNRITFVFMIVILFICFDRELRAGNFEQVISGSGPVKFTAESENYVRPP